MLAVVMLSRKKKEKQTNYAFLLELKKLIPSISLLQCPADFYREQAVQQFHCLEQTSFQRKKVLFGNYICHSGSAPASSFCLVLLTFRVTFLMSPHSED